MKKAYLYAGISIFLWGTLATATKLLLGSLGSMQVLAVSSFFAFGFLVVLNLVKGKLAVLKTYRWKDYLQIAGIGSLGTFFYNLLFNIGVSRMQASQAFIINYLWPVMTVFFACLILKEKLTARKIVAILCSFLGVVIVTTGGKLTAMDSGNLTGALCCVLAAVVYGLFSVLNKHKNYDASVSMMLYYGVCLVASVLFLPFSEEFPALSLPQILGLTWIGIFANAIPYTTWALAMAHGDTAKISNLAYITPFLSLVWTFLLLKEPFSLASVAGLLVIVIGIFIQVKEEK